ncbi:hypothetical protein [Nocardiopsis alborubida]|uniref:Uncharacterized protein n=1 Tax=Nocardiopsis alborubida TaxID=146802 RepID=A0A7X6MHM1_9ACTN|nr:hypothetical protein [Nocardiopsis alborubida]NKY99600.1 hypothetical protein [Nocardiopsis alborubida]
MTKNHWYGVLSYVVPFLTGMVLLTYVGETAALVWLGIYFVVLFVWAFWMRSQRKARAHQAASPSVEEPTP